MGSTFRIAFLAEQEQITRFDHFDCHLLREQHRVVVFPHTFVWLHVRCPQSALLLMGALANGPTALNQTGDFYTTFFMPQCPGRARASLALALPCWPVVSPYEAGIVASLKRPSATGACHAVFLLHRSRFRNATHVFRASPCKLLGCSPGLTKVFFFFYSDFKYIVPQYWHVICFLLPKL